MAQKMVGATSACFQVAADNMANAFFHDLKISEESEAKHDTGGETQNVCQQIENFLNLLENRQIKVRGTHTSTPESQSVVAKIDHEAEMDEARTGKTLVLCNEGICLSNSVALSHMSRQLFRIIYVEWLAARENTLKMLADVSFEMKKKNWIRIFKIFVSVVSVVAQVVAKILAYTPYKMAAKVIGAIPTIIEGLKFLISTIRKNREKEPSQDEKFEEMNEIMEQDVLLSSEIYMFGLLCEMHFGETKDLFTKFRQEAVDDQTVDFVEDDMGLVCFFIKIIESDPDKPCDFFKQVSDAYREFHNFEERTDAQTSFCTVVEDDPSVLDTLRNLAWRPVNTLEQQATENALLKEWKNVTNSALEEVSNCKEAAAKIQHITEILQTQKEDIKRNVSLLL